ncbi:MAG: hypothetical protein RLZZ584_2685 [Pseudomonadota bacterium]
MMMPITRRHLTAAAALALCTLAGAASAQEKIKVGFMLPYTGTYATLGVAIENGFRQYIDEQGGKLAGKTVEYVKVDDESDPAKAADNANKLVKRDNVDVMVGTVHSGVVMAMAKVAKDNNTLLIIPNAGANVVTGPLCAPNIFRSSFSNWQPGFAMGKVAADKKYKTAVTLTWKYAAGDESVGGFKEGFEASGGKVVKELNLPFPNVEFQALLTEIAALAGLKDKIALVGPGFLTDGTLEAQGKDAEGLLTTLHYADDLTNKKDQAFTLQYAKTYKLQPDVYAVQGYDAAQMLAAGVNAVKGDLKNRDGLVKGIEAARIDSPRGAFTLSKAHNPVQDIYLRKVVGKENKNQGVAVQALADPARGCKM